MVEGAAHATAATAEREGSGVVERARARLEDGGGVAEREREGDDERGGGDRWPRSGAGAGAGACTVRGALKEARLSWRPRRMDGEGGRALVAVAVRPWVVKFEPLEPQTTACGPAYIPMDRAPQELTRRDGPPHKPVAA